MNVYEFNGAIFLMCWKIEHSIQPGKAELNRMFNLLTNENNRTIERMAKHSLFVLYNTLVDLCHLIGGSIYYKMSQLYITKNAHAYNQIARPYNKECTLDDVRVQ